MIMKNVEGVVSIELYVFGNKELLPRGIAEYCDIESFVNCKEIYLTSKRASKEFYILHLN